MNIKAAFGLAGLTAVLWMSSAQASTVLVDVMQPVEGGMGFSTEIDASSAGELNVTLIDKAFPSPLAAVNFGIANAGATLMSLSNAGTLTLDLTAPAKLVVDVFAQSDAGGAGLYQLTADFNPSSAVPLPGSSACLSAALLLMVLWQLAGADRKVWRYRAPGAQATVIRFMA